MLRRGGGCCMTSFVIRSAFPDGFAADHRAWLVVVLVTLVIVAAAIEVGSFAIAVRKLQIEAEQTARTRAARLRASGVAWGRPPGSVHYSRWIAVLGPGKAVRTDQGAVHVELDKKWRSPLFGVRRGISVTATAAILPTDRPGSTRIAIVA